MFTKLYLVTASILIIFLVCGVHGLDNKIVQVELEQLIKDCDAHGFITGYKAFQRELQLADEKMASLASFELVAQETKKEKLVELTTTLARGTIKAYEPCAKFLAQAVCAVSAGIMAICCVTSHFYGTDTGKTGLLVMAAAACGITVPCVHYGKSNYHHAFHKEVCIKNDIIRLNKIVAFIEFQKGYDQKA